jgi:hypothetical protein
MKKSLPFNAKYKPILKDKIISVRVVYWDCGNPKYTHRT